MTNQCGNSNYLCQPPAKLHSVTPPMAWYAFLWTVILSYWMPGDSLRLRFTQAQKRELGVHVLVTLGCIVVLTIVVLVLAYGQSATRGY
jgi:threonine/homoserine/homoserine lactone efflux protein